VGLFNREKNTRNRNKDMIMKKFTATIKVYLKNAAGCVFEYDIMTESEKELNAKAREHIGQIWETGYRHCNNEEGKLTFYPPHWIDKITATGDGISTSYPDKTSST
jgi:hypothetical protein